MAKLNLMAAVCCMCLLSCFCVVSCKFLDKNREIINALDQLKMQSSMKPENLQSEKLAEFLKMMGKKKSATVNGTGCRCERHTYDCGCCVYLRVPEIKLDDTACVNVTYLQHDYGISLTFSIDGKVIFRTTVSARNPPPLCFGIPELEKWASICLDLYDLDISGSAFSGCTSLEIELIHIKLVDVKLGCFRIPLSKKFPQKLLEDAAAMETIQRKQKAFIESINLARAEKLKFGKL